mmetsp:Transcript_14071/g.42590  ORF Transcript_14071/g.42590 Transcript_14071/m.42590 type:complete len:391 (-) Transcript_14071:1166-2338(-)
MGLRRAATTCYRISGQSAGCERPRGTRLHGGRGVVHGAHARQCQVNERCTPLRQVGRGSLPGAHNNKAAHAQRSVPPGLRQPVYGARGREKGLPHDVALAAAPDGFVGQFQVFSVHARAHVEAQVPAGPGVLVEAAHDSGTHTPHEGHGGARAGAPPPRAEPGHNGLRVERAVVMAVEVDWGRALKGCKDGLHRSLEKARHGGLDGELFVGHERVEAEDDARGVAQPRGLGVHPVFEARRELAVLSNQARHAPQDRGLAVELHLEGLPALEEGGELVRVRVLDARALGDGVDEAGDVAQQVLLGEHLLAEGTRVERILLATASAHAVVAHVPFRLPVRQHLHVRAHLAADGARAHRYLPRRAAPVARGLQGHELERGDTRELWPLHLPRE